MREAILPIEIWRSGQGNSECPRCHGAGELTILVGGTAIPAACETCDSTGRVEILREQWVLRHDGGFLFFGSLNPAEIENASAQVLHARTVSREIATTLLFASRIYQHLGFSTSATVHVAFGLVHISQWRLAERRRKIGPPNTVSAGEITAILGRIAPNLAEITYGLTRDLLEVFDFYELDPADHKTWVNDFLHEINDTPWTQQIEYG